MSKLLYYVKRLSMDIVVAAFLIAFYISSSAISNRARAVMFPNFLMVFLAIVLIWDTVGNIIKAVKEYKSEEAKTIAALLAKHKKGIIIFLSAVVFVNISPIIGFYVTTFLYLVLLTFYLGGKKLIVTIPSMAALTVIMYLIFNEYIQMRLPAGFLI